MLSAPTLSLNQILCKSACARRRKIKREGRAHTRRSNKSALTAILRGLKSSSGVCVTRFAIRLGFFSLSQKLLIDGKTVDFGEWKTRSVCGELLKRGQLTF
jgi:hypothetical protein